MNIFKIKILIFNSEVFYVFRTRRFIFRKTVVYSVMVWYGMVHITCIGISSQVGRRVCSILKDEPLGWKHVEDIKIKN